MKIQDQAEGIVQHLSLTFPRRQILGFPTLKDFADDNFKFDEKGEKFSKG